MKCPSCGRNFNKKEFLVDHINQVHQNDIPKNMNTEQYIYYSSHGTIKGKCMCGCGKDTEWNYKTGKPYKLNSSPECISRLRATAVKNGADGHLLKSMDYQKNVMQKGRNIAGVYTFKNGIKIDYLAKNELAFLKFCETVCEFTGNMIVSAYQTFTYMDGDIERTYMPDFYLPDYNLLVEIKGNNQNPEYQKDTGYKVKLKDDVMRKQKEFNYIKIVDNKFGEFLEILFNIVNVIKNNKTLNSPIILAEASSNPIISQELYKIEILGKWGDIVGTAICSNLNAISGEYSIIPIYYSDGSSLNMDTSIHSICPNNQCSIRIYRYIGEPNLVFNLFSYIGSGVLEEKYKHPIMGLNILLNDLGILPNHFTKIE